MSATIVQYPTEPSVPRQRLIRSESGVKVRVTAVPSEYATPFGAPSKKQLDAAERMALVLDVDECLVHSKFQSENQYRQEEYRPTDQVDYADSFEIVMDDGERAVVNKRPGVDKFLEEMSKHFDLYAFTAGLESYGKPILDALDPKDTIFKSRFFRESCEMKKGMFLKDLRAVRSDLSRVILIDNNPVSFLMQPSNGIPVPSFYDDANDRTLETLEKVLMSLKEVQDVRPRLHQLFRLADLLSEHQRVILSS